MGFPKVTGTHFVLLQTEARTGHILKKDQSPYTFAENSDVLFTVCDSFDEAKKQAGALVRRHPGIEVNIYNAQEEVIEVIRDEMYLKRAVKFTAPQVGNFRWGVAAQLFLVLLIGFLIQNVLSVAIADEFFKREVLDISLETPIDSTINLMLSKKMRQVEITFAIALALGFGCMGWVVDAAGTRRGMGASVVLAALASIASAFVSSTNGLNVSYFVMGIAIGGIIPAALKATAEWFPSQEKGWVTGWLGAGILSGWLLTALGVPFLLHSLGWRFTFIAAGLLGLGWCIWWYFTFHQPEEQKNLSRKELAYIQATSFQRQITGLSLPWLQLWKMPRLWAIIACFLLTTPLWLLWIELPDLFRPAFPQTFSLSLHDFTFSPDFIAFALAGIAGSLTVGWLSRYLLNRKVPMSQALNKLLLATACVPVLLLSLFFIPVGTFFILIIALSLAAHQGWFSQVYFMIVQQFPKSRVASVTGIASAFGVLGSMTLAYFAKDMVAKLGLYNILWLSVFYLLAYLLLRRLNK